MIIGLLIGSAIGFGATAYIDYKDDGEIFNGSVAWYDYLGATALFAAAGAGFSVLSGMSFAVGGFSFWGNSAALTYGVSITGTQILATAGAIGMYYLMSKGYGPRIGHNYYENKQFRQLCKKHHLTKEHARTLHDYISHKNYSYHEIEEIIFELFGKYVLLYER